VQPQQVTGIDHVGGQWRITSQLGGNTNTKDFDGVVITGSGEPWPPLQKANQRVFDGRSFWTQLPAVLALIHQDRDPSVVIIGAGGTAAAVAGWFARVGIRNIIITIVGREPTLFARYQNWFEDRLFSDSVAWDALPNGAKNDFLARLTRGIVWTSVIDDLADQDNIVYQCYEARGFTAPTGIAAAPGNIPRIFVELDAVGPPPHPPVPGGYPILLDATVFVDARGFDRYWFVNSLLQSSPLQAHFAAPNRPIIEADITHCLSVGGGNFPDNFHVPMLASRQGPAAPNLFALGWMSDRIFRCYVTPNPP